MLGLAGAALLSVAVLAGCEKAPAPAENSAPANSAAPAPATPARAATPDATKPAAGARPAAAPAANDTATPAGAPAAGEKPAANATAAAPAKAGEKPAPASPPAKIATAKPAAETPPAPPAPAGTPKAITTKSGVKMVLIPAGTFKMGAAGQQPDEAPVHTVRIDAFLMDQTEVTQEQFAKMEMSDPSHFKNPKNPVEQINWPQAVLFCNRRSEEEGLEPCYNEDTVECNYDASGYRLPTEAEWEYACRAGSTSLYPFGEPRRLGEYAWYADNASKHTHPVAQKKANPWGLFDMLGNVSEWCNDAYDKGYYRISPAGNPHGPAKGKMYVLRGGGWTWRADQIRSSTRMPDNPGFTDACLARDAIGFRCVRKAPAAVSPTRTAGGKP